MAEFTRRKKLSANYFSSSMELQGKISLSVLLLCASKSKLLCLDSNESNKRLPVFASSSRLSHTNNITFYVSHEFSRIEQLLSSSCHFLNYFFSFEGFCGMKNLQELYLRGNYFAGQLPLCLGSLNKLQVLHLSLNQLSGNLPSSFNSLESLEYLSLSDNNFKGLFSLSLLANLTQLKVLKLSSTSDMLQVQIQKVPGCLNFN